MRTRTPDCLDDRRRHEVRRQQRNGLDYLEVSDDQLRLTVYFLGHAPEGLGPRNVRITGGRRIRGIRVVDVAICPQNDPELDNCMVVTVDRPGDFSTYRLCLVNLPADAPFDPRYRCIDFTFKASCPTDLDCASGPACLPEVHAQPEISYLAKDYASFRRLILDRMSVVMPEWADRHVPDLGITLVELLAYAGDYLSYYQDSVATEAYLDTARQRISVRRHARLVDYLMHEGCNARAWLHLNTSADLTGEHALPAADLSFLTGFDRMPQADGRVLTWDDLRDVPAARYEVFEPLSEGADARIELRTAHNRIRVYTWGQAECCLPRGATSATLVDGLAATPGLVLEAGPNEWSESEWAEREAARRDRPGREEIGSDWGEREQPERPYDRERGRDAEGGRPPSHHERARRDRLDRDLDAPDGPGRGGWDAADRSRDDGDGFAARDRDRDRGGRERGAREPERGWDDRGREDYEHDDDPHPGGWGRGGPPERGPRRQAGKGGKGGEELEIDGPVAPPQAGSTRELELRAGDVLIFEEVIGPKTGDPDDADPARRHAVRLTRVERVVDDLYGQPLLEVEWGEEDALPFPLCLSVIGPPPQCAPIGDVSVARGNVVLVDHGRRRAPEPLGCVPVDAVETVCEREGRPSDVVLRPGRFRPALAAGPLTFSQPLAADASAARLLEQDPRQALPWIRLHGHADTRCGAERDGPPRGWTAVRDLLASAAGDPHFVVEMDDRGRAHLRFGDGEVGRQPAGGVAFEAGYRVGNGPAGNVGADAIVLAVSREVVSGAAITPRNPLPARGGTAPEPLADVKLFAPFAFRHVLERAVTADDYAAVAAQHAGVQRAAGELRWNGSWYQARVAVDPLGRAEAGDELLDSVETHLYRFRRIGHDLDVRAAPYVPLDLVLQVCVHPTWLRGHVKAALLERFGSGRQGDGSPGYFHPDQLSFGTGVPLSRLVAAAQAIPGVASVDVARLQRLFAGPNGEIEQGYLPIGPLEIARLDSDPNFPENGRIRFDLRGGR